MDRGRRTTVPIWNSSWCQNARRVHIYVGFALPVGRSGENSLVSGVSGSLLMAGLLWHQPPVAMLGGHGRPSHPSSGGEPLECDQMGEICGYMKWFTSRWWIGTCLHLQPMRLDQPASRAPPPTALIIPPRPPR